MGRPAKWTPEQRAQALDVYREKGLAAAHHETGIPKPTITDWAVSVGIRSYGNERTAAATEAIRLTREERAARLADDLLAIAEDRAKLIRAHQVETPRDEQTLMTVSAIAIDKSQLLAGQATSRHETTADDLVNLRDELLGRAKLRIVS